MVAMARALVCLCLCVFLYEVRGSYIPQDMNRTIQTLLQHYISPRDRFNGRPVFSRELLSGRLETKMLFLGGVLDTYEKLIGQMLEQLPTPSPQTEMAQSRGQAASPASGARLSSAGTDPSGDVRTKLTYILGRVRKLKTSGFQEQERLLQRLQDLQEIKRDNLIVQSKALWELPWLYEEASSLSESFRNQRRRRRHTRPKTRPRV
ncbi:interferon gamma isoform X2 [Parambassis ranga]|uniref:Interferon gamma isoform X2 n=1 Tax=Parambassis ranga TaxID=210632 RepID=A0A6P7HPT9_9TELE|nr:interferon gamma-like isoform X2 [Parambassis ranga]